MQRAQAAGPGKIVVDRDRLARELDTLAAFSDTPAPAVTRIVFSPVDLQARSYVKELCAEAGLDVREDAVGNTFARWIGEDPDLPAVATGSHIDAIPFSGRYDGTVGVLGGLESIRALQRAGFRPRRSLELLIFTSEEPTRFGIGCLGSRLLAGSLDAATARRLKDRDGNTLQQALTAAGFSGPLESVLLARDFYAAFVELHIEQGPILDRGSLTAGVVTAIAAPAAVRITLEGQGGHAGAVLMPDRHDAFLAAAEIALAVERIAKSTGSGDSVGTVGICNLFPAAANSIPSRVQMEVDVRDTDLERRDASLAALFQSANEICRARQVEMQYEIVNADAPARCSPAVIGALTQAAGELGLSCLPMVSRAYHDTLFMSRVTEAGMLFIPCKDGFSHRPEEYAAPEDIARGALLLAHAMARLAA